MIEGYFPHEFDITLDYDDVDVIYNAISAGGSTKIEELTVRELKLLAHIREELEKANPQASSR